MWSNIFSVSRSFLEIIYFLSGIAVAIVAIIGLKQLRIALEQLKTSIKQVEIGMNQVSVGIEQVSLLKQDIETRNQRQAVEKSIEFIEKYKKVIFPLASQHHKTMSELNYEPYSKEVLDIKDFPFSNWEEWKSAVDKVMKTEIFDIFNELELFSSAFISRLADEQLAFQPLGKTFVNLIEKNYDLFCVCRVTAPYINTSKLYMIWKHRIKKRELDKESKKLEDVRTLIKDTKIIPIGLEDKQSGC